MKSSDDTIESVKPTEEGLPSDDRTIDIEIRKRKIILKKVGLTTEEVIPREDEESKTLVETIEEIVDKPIEEKSEIIQTIPSDDTIESVKPTEGLPSDDISKDISVKKRKIKSKKGGVISEEIIPQEEDESKTLVETTEEIVEKPIEEKTELKPIDDTIESVKPTEEGLPSDDWSNRH